MKKTKTKMLIFLLLGTVAISSCKKEAENIYTMFDDVKVTFHGYHPYSVTDYKMVQDGDSVYIDYTVTSANEDMSSVVEELMGSANGGGPVRTTIEVPEEQRRSFSKVLKIKARRDGKMSYRIYATNGKNHYIGDGYTKVTIEVEPSYMIMANRRIYAPDTLTKVNTSFYSFTRGEAFNFTEGKANSADIDFGLWRNVVHIVDQNRDDITYNYYSPGADPNPFPIYDISDWERRETKFSTPIKNGTNTFLQSLMSSSTIEENAKARNLNVTATKYTKPGDGLIAGSLVYFLTPEGKYGAFLVHQVSEDYEGRPFINISTKIQK